MDAYLLGDLWEQERWGRIRELIEDSEDREIEGNGAFWSF